MEKGFWRLFWSSVKRSYGAQILILGAPSSFLFWRFGPDTKIGVEFVFVGAWLAIPVVMSLAHMAYVLSGRVVPVLPRVLQSRQRTISETNSTTILLLEASELFTHGVAVSVYYTDNNGFEILAALGQVINVQDDKRIQVGISQLMPGQEEVEKKIVQNEKNLLESLRVKPTVPAVDFSESYGG